MMTDDERNTAALEAVADLMAHVDPEAIITGRFLLVTEVIDDEDRCLWGFAGPNQKAWDTLGLLAYAEQIEREVV